MKTLVSAWLVTAAMVRLEAAVSVQDPVTARLEAQIRAASESGRLREVALKRQELAAHAYALGAWEEAERQYELLLASRPPRRERVLYFTELGKIRDAMDDPSGAIDAYEDAIHDDSHAFEARIRLGTAYARIDLYAPAEHAYQNAARLNPRSHEPWRGLGKLYLRRGYLEKAVESLDAARQLAPGDLETALLLADAYRRRGQPEAAETLLQQMRTRGASELIDVRLGELYRARGQWAKAAQAWEQALAARPALPEVRLNLSLAYEQLGRSREAERLLDGLLKEFPRSPLLHFWRAKMAMNRGETGGARTHALEVRRLRATPLILSLTDQLLAQLER